MRLRNHVASGTLFLRAGWLGQSRNWDMGDGGERFGEGPMCVTTARLASAVGVCSLVLFTAALLVFPSLPTTGAGLSTAPGRVLVDRTLKGDRLPLAKPAKEADEFAAPPLSPVRTLPQRKVPAGCDPAFSPISSPQLAHVFRRCVV
jgi:hypothetical protein